MDRHSNIMNAASNLLGISFLLITGLSVTRSNGQSFGGEVAWVSAPDIRPSRREGSLRQADSDSNPGRAVAKTAGPDALWTSSPGKQTYLGGAASIGLASFSLGMPSNVA